MQTVEGFSFFPLHFDEVGNLQQASEFDDLKQFMTANQATDAILIAHGFRNDENDAMELYSGFLNTFRDHLNGGSLPALAGRNFVVGGVFWPSKAFKESFSSDGSAQSLDDDDAGKQALVAQLEDLQATVATDPQKPALDHAIQLLDQVKGSDAAQDEFVASVLTLLRNPNPDQTEGLDIVLAADGSTLLAKLGPVFQLPVAGADDDEGGAVLALDSTAAGEGDSGEAQGIGSILGSIFGRIGQFLNFTTWYTMKERSGNVGANGVSKAVRDLKAAMPELRIHLVGHSLGGRLMAGCSKSLGQTPKLGVDSLTLLEAAFSHYGFSPDSEFAGPGFFRSVVDSQVVQGPFIATFSAKDEVVGNVYAIASRLADQVVSAVGDANDKFGGIGRNGAQKTPESSSEPLHPVGTPYRFPTNKMILCLDGSANMINDHGDVKNAFVTYAFASAVAASATASQSAKA